MTTTTNAPESASFTTPELHAFAAARDAVAHMSKNFEQWITIARAVEIAHNKADQIGGRSTFQRIIDQQGIAHALGNTWASQKATASKLLKILGRLPEVEAWRATLSRHEQFAWQAPTTIYKYCPIFKSETETKIPDVPAFAGGLNTPAPKLATAQELIDQEPETEAEASASAQLTNEQVVEQLTERYGVVRSMILATLWLKTLEALGSSSAAVEPVDQVTDAHVATAANAAPKRKHGAAPETTTSV